MKWITSASREVVRMMLQPLVPNESRGVTILAYHLIGADTQSPVDLPLDVFRSQMCELADVARVVSLTDALTYLETGAGCEQPVVVITFDDAFDNFRTRAWPVLSRLGLPCTLYVPVGFLEGTAGAPLRGAERLSPMPLAAVRDLAVDARLTIGSHSWCHGDLRALTQTDLAEDLRRSRHRLEDVTGNPVDHFCYPRAKWSRAVEQQYY
jgi:peptidoglycan/xylan/chitin deacetylase (PgdA/CDA1 family)